MPNRVRAQRTLVTVAAAVALLGSIGLNRTLPARAAVDAFLQFDTPKPAGVSGNGFETDLRLDSTNGRTNAYEAAPQSLSSTISTIARSTDGGQSFKFAPASASGSSGGKLPTCPAGGGDAELNVDSAGHLYFNDLTLANFSVARSDDQGVTFNAGTNCAGVPQTAVDRQWYASYGDPTSNTSPGYLGLASDFLDMSNQLNCPAGSPGATGNVLTLNLSPPAAGAGALAGLQFGPLQVASCDEGIMGNDEMYNYGGNGGLKIYDVHDNKALTSISMVRCDVVGISVSNTTGFANCQDKLVSSFPGFKTGANFPTMTVDTAGNLFAVWAEAPVTAGNISGNTQLYFSTSTDQGNTWSTHPLPTPGLLQDVMAWPGAGSPGRIDVAFYGAPDPWVAADTTGPDSIPGHYALYLQQTLDGGTTWRTTPVEASEHMTHYGTMYTLIGGQSGNRTLGDFIQMRIGPQGEANISYSDSNNQNSGSNPQPMFVRQNVGPSVFAAENGTGMVNLPPSPTLNCVTDPSGDATFDAGGTVGPNNPNLDLTNVCMSKPDTTHYRVTMTIANLTSLTPGTGAGGTTEIWQTQWHEPSSADHTNGGNLYFVYAESVAGGAPTCWDGQAATLAAGGGVELTFPGLNQLTGTACVITQAAPGTIQITVPTSDVSVASPDSATLYSVTGNTETLPSGNAETPAPLAGIGGQFPNVIDVARSFDFALQPFCVNSCTPEVPWTPVLVAVGAALVGVGLVRRRHRNPSSDLIGQ